MSVLERIRALEARAERLKAVQFGADESIALDTRLQELTEMYGLLTRANNQLNAFRDQKIELGAPPPSVESAKKHLLKVQDRFKKERKATSLTKGKDWIHLHRFVQEISDAINDDLCLVWKTFWTDAFAGQTPSHLQSILASTEDNKKTSQRYREVHAKFQHAVGDLPTEKQAFDKVRALGAELEKVALDFDFDVPEEVNNFLKAVETIRGAPLDLLTDNVRDWLSKQGTISRYKIAARIEYMET